jgi:hypothetical protein
VTQRGGSVTSTCHSIMSKCPAPMEALVPARTALWLAGYSVNIRLIKKWKFVGLRTAFSPPYLVYIHLDLPTTSIWVGTARVAPAALRCCTVQNHIQCAAPVWRLLWCGLACHWTAIRGILTIYSYDKNDTTVCSVTPISGMPCFICYYIYIFLWQKRYGRSHSNAHQWNAMFF